MKLSRFPLAALGFLALAFTLAASDAFASAGVVGQAWPALPVAALGAGSIARLAACRFGPRIVFDKPDDAGLAEFTTAFDLFQKSTLEKLEKAAGDSAELRETIANMEQVLAKRAKGGVGGDVPESWGSQFTKDEGALATLADAHGINKNAKHRVAIKSVTIGSTVGTVQRDNAIDPLPRRRLTIRNLLDVVPTDSNAVEFLRQNARTNNAAMVAEGAAKPESDLDFELASTTTRVIAHWIKASKQVLSDMPQLRGVIDGELIDGLREKEEDQLLYGDGTGQNLTGLVPGATAYAPPILIEDGNMIDTVGLAMLQSALAKYPANGIVMHPSDWMRIRLLKDGDGKYILGDPGADVQPILFGRPVVESEAIAVDKFLVGDFRRVGRLYDRWQPIVEAGYVNDDFIKNLVTLLGEERIALAIRRAGAVVYGEFGNEG